MKSCMMFHKTAPRRILRMAGVLRKFFNLKENKMLSPAEKLEMSIFGISVGVGDLAQNPEGLDVDKTIQLVQLAERILNLVKAKNQKNVLMN